ncbi:hypothetical protein F4802DRAFT_252405 [Xylaria palmicola]|nr:hypothetical protein F4802DRAFT_252405 [Xylaria palmicola]
MFLPRLELHKKEGSQGPCPDGNGTMIGDEQQFVVYCNTRFRGKEIFRQKADSLAECTGLCTSFQNPRCEGAQFSEKGNCVLVGALMPDSTRSSRVFDSAAAIFPQPGPTSSCAQQGSGKSFLSQNSSFALECGQVVNGKDLEQQFQMTLEACLAACSANPACGGVSYDPAQTSGFQNCYLKTTIDDSDMAAKPGVDSALLVNNAVEAPDVNVPADPGTSVIAGAPTSVGPPSMVFSTVVATPGTSDSVVTVSVPVPVTSILTTGIVADATPPSVVPVFVPAPATSTSSTAALADPTTEASAAATAGTSSTGTGDGQGVASNSEGLGSGNEGPSTSSNAWIAAPVIGGIAALTLVLAVFVLWGRRRRGPDRRAGTSETAGAWMSRTLVSARARVTRGRVFGGEKMRLADSDGEDDSRLGSNRGGFKVISGSGRRLDPSGQSAMSGTGPGLGGMIVTTGGGRVVDTGRDGAQSRGSQGSAGLRDSQNPLRQNRLTGNWLGSIPGIPAEFRGPDAK